MFNSKRILMGFTFLCVMLFASNSLSAQSLDREIGIRFSSFDNFDFLYKKELKENRWLRLRATFTNVNIISQSNNFNSGPDARFALGTAIGFEFRKPLTSHLELIHGPELRFATTLTSVNDNMETNVSGGLGYVAGVQYNFNSSISLGAEIIPSIYLNYQRMPDESNSVNIGAGFSSNSAALTLVYRFPRKEK